MSAFAPRPPRSARPQVSPAARPRASRGSRGFVETLAVGIAHEVRNPLNAIQINLRLLAKDLEPLVPSRRHRVWSLLEKVSDELHGLDRFVGEFLRFAGPPRMRREKVDLNRLVDDLAGLVRPSCEQAGISLDLRLDRRTLTISGDALQFKHALLNVLLNAIQASHPGGRISMRTARSGPLVIIRVSDNGDGVSSEALGRAFELFYTTREGGTGLGLPIARRIVEDHRGSIEIQPGRTRGTCVTIALPGARGA